MTRVVRIHEFGGPEGLKIDNLDLPAPGPGEVRIAIQAIGLNRADGLLRQNQYIAVAKQMGATVIATTRKRAKAEALRQAGADHVVVTSEEALTERVQAITATPCPAVIFDAIAGKTIPTLLDCLAVGGRCILYGLLDSAEPSLPLMPFLVKGVSLHGYTVFAYTGYPNFGLPQQTEAVAAAQDFLLPRLADGRLQPVVSEIFRLEDVVAAHRSLESNQQTGKIVLQVT